MAEIQGSYDDLFPAVPGALAALLDAGASAAVFVNGEGVDGTLGPLEGDQSAIELLDRGAGGDSGGLTGAIGTCYGTRSGDSLSAVAAEVGAPAAVAGDVGQVVHRGAGAAQQHAEGGAAVRELDHAELEFGRLGREKLVAQHVQGQVPM